MNSSPKPLVFEFSKIPISPENNQQQRPTTRTLNESINTCPLTNSNFTVDGGPSFSIRSSHSSSSGSTMGSDSNNNSNNNNNNSGFMPNIGYNTNRGGGARMNKSHRSSTLSGGEETSASWPGNNNNNSGFPPNIGYNTNRGGGTTMNNNNSNSGGLQRHRSSSIGGESASWPAESPDPMSATARYCPGSPVVNAAEVGDQPNLYLPMRRHHRLEAAPFLPARIVPTKKEDATSSSSPDHLSSSFSSYERRSSFTLFPLAATIVFVDLEGYSKSSDVHQRHLTCDFMSTVRNLLMFAYGEMPVRGNIDNYVILPTGDGAAVIVIQPPRRVIGENQGEMNGGGSECNGCDGENSKSNTSKKDKSNSQLPRGIACPHCSTQSLRTTEETALWIGSSLLLWASDRQIGLRVGLNSGELSIVEDPYGDPNVCGDAINMAARIMDTALPGQILASASTVIPNLNILAAEELAAMDLIGGCYVDDDENDQAHDSIIEAKRKQHDCTHCPRIKYEIAAEASEVVVKHGVTTNVQSITCTLHPLPRPEDLPQELQPLEGGPQPLPTSATTSLSRSTGDSTALPPAGDVLEGLHPMAKMRSNPKKQSFASLSSLAANATESQHSLTNKSRKNTNRQSGTTQARNASWKLDTPQGSTRLSMLSQLSNEAEMVSNTSSRTLTTSNATSTNTSQHQQVAVVQQQQQQQQQQASVPRHVGNHRTPATKWYMKIKPTEMQASSDNQIKPKVLPQELIRRHKRIAFLGIMHDNLSKGFVNILENDPTHRWDQVYILFPSDGCLRNHLAKNYQDCSVETLIRNKQECRKTLMKILSPVVHNLRFLQYDQLMHCGSYWDWKDPGGFIHISPLTWGANPKTCPAMNYYWNSRVPSPEYRVYREGLEYLLGTAIPFEEEESGVVGSDLRRTSLREECCDVIEENGP